MVQRKYRKSVEFLFAEKYVKYIRTKLQFKETGNSFGHLSNSYMHTLKADEYATALKGVKVSQPALRRTNFQLLMLGLVGPISERRWLKRLLECDNLWCYCGLLLFKFIKCTLRVPAKFFVYI